MVRQVTLVVRIVRRSYCFYVSFIALLMAVTGIYFTYPYVKNVFNYALSGKADLPKEEEINSPDSLVVKNNSDFDITAFETRKLYTQSSSFRIPLNGKNKKGKELKNIPVTVFQKEGRYSERNILVFDKYSGKLLSNKPYAKLSTAEKYSNANYDIHTGSYFGLFGTIIWFIAGLICTSMPVTGFLVCGGGGGGGGEHEKKGIRHT